MPTARTLIRGALTDLGVAGAEQPMDAAMVDDALALLNALLDAWSTERLSIYVTPATVIPWPAGQATRTWGPGGDIASPRPLKLATHATYMLEAYDYPLEVLERQEQYAQLQWKGMTSTLPLAVYYEAQVPLGVLYLWPVPAVDTTLTLYPWQPLRQFTALDDEIDMPPGYLRALRTNLALECAPSYGVQPSPLLVRSAEQAKQDVFVQNTVVGRLSLRPGAGVPMSGLAAFYAGRG